MLEWRLGCDVQRCEPGSGPGHGDARGCSVRACRPEHLLAHRSGIGDYLNEEAGHEVTDYVLTVPAQDLATTEQYLAVLGGHPAKFPAGERFSYCNSGYVVLALIAERVSGIPFPQLVQQRVCAPAGMRDTGFLRSDGLPGRTALGYLAAGGEPRTNVFHLVPGPALPCCRRIPDCSLLTWSRTIDRLLHSADSQIGPLIADVPALEAAGQPGGVCNAAAALDMLTGGGDDAAGGRTTHHRRGRSRLGLGDPLWFYILKEAEAHGASHGSGGAPGDRLAR